jgi:hypothetical protein
MIRVHGGGGLMPLVRIFSLEIFFINKHQFVKKKTFSSGRINKHNYLI